MVDPFLGRGLGHGHQSHGAFLKRPDRIPVPIPVDAATGGVRGGSGDAGSPEGFAVDPGGVVVPVEQIDRPFGHDPVKEGPVRDTAVEALHGPAPADDPVGVRVCGGIGVDALQVLAQLGGTGEVTLAKLNPAHHGMNMSVLKARDEHPAAEVDDFGAGAAEVEHVVVRTDRLDPSVLDR
jgi:hypothetical protein